MALSLLCALVFCRGYKNYLQEKLLLSEAFCKLLSHFHSRIECFLTPPELLLEGFENRELEAAGYIEAAGRAGVCDGYFEIKDSLCIPEEEKKILSEFFEKFGSEYRSGTLRLTEHTHTELLSRVEKKRKRINDEIKVVQTVAAALALGTVILLI